MNRTSLKRIAIAGGLLLTFLCGILLTQWYFTRSVKVKKEEATVLLEQIRAVSKLITLEGYFSEIYDYQDHYGYDLSPFRKKALIRVKAKVSIGYDMEKMVITSNPDKKTIEISDIPPAELLSIEHDLDYYDIQEGMFNSFSTEDYNRLNANAKEFIRQKAQESDLFDKARLQRNRLFEMIGLMVESAGWSLVLEHEAVMPQDTLLR